MESLETQGIIFIISEVIDFAGVAIIALGALIGVILCAQDLLRHERAVNAYRHLRTFLGRSLLPSSSSWWPATSSRRWQSSRRSTA